MAWFRKEKKPRPPRAQRLEIPPDVWEKCEACGHTDIREKFERNANVCPSCDHHRRIRAHEYVSLLLDEGTIDEKDVELGSVVVVDVGSVVVVVVLVSGGVNEVVLLLVEDSVPVAKAIPAAIGLPTPAVAAGASAKPPASAMTATGRDMARRERDDPRWRSDMAAFPLRRHNTTGNRQISRGHPTSQPDHTSPSRLPSTTAGVACAA